MILKSAVNVVSNFGRFHALISLLNSLNAIAEKYNQIVIFSVHPRTKKRLDEIKDIKIDDRIKFIKAVLALPIWRLPVGEGANLVINLVINKNDY